MNIRDVLRTLNQMRAAGVVEQYAIGGAVGATFYLEPVSTLDVDVFVAVRQEPDQLLISLEPILDWLKDLGYSMKGEYVMVADWPVQFLVPPGPLVEEALADAVEFEVESDSARVFSAEHLAAIALQTGRGKDKARLVQFFEEEALDLGRFRAIIDRHGLTDALERFEKQFLT